MPVIPKPVEGLAESLKNHRVTAIPLEELARRLNSHNQDASVIFCLDPKVPGNRLPATVLKAVLDDDGVWRVKERLLEGAFTEGVKVAQSGCTCCYCSQKEAEK